MERKMDTKTMVLGAVLTALVVALQFLSMEIRFGTFSITLSLTPIVIGAVLCGPWMGAWLGLVLGVVILFVDAAVFWQVHPFGTFLTVIAKGILCGVLPGFVFRLLKNMKNKSVAMAVTSLSSPITNTGIFLLGCYIWFIPKIKELYGSVSSFLIIILGLNFLIELLLNFILTPVVVRLLNIRKKQN